jgi:Ca-activated chloride channel family protein
MNVETCRGLVDAAGHEIPLRNVEMIGEVLGGSLCMRLRQHYENTESRAIEALYTFPVPSEATITGFAMTSGERSLQATVEEREEAFARYTRAIEAGDGAALLDQERENVFSASVGNLLPGRTAVIEIEYVQPLHASEGALRVVLPTLVAPRYVPGSAHGDRTAHGTAEPTDRVPDADRISPAIGPADYTASLQLSIASSAPLEVESPSHALAVTATATGAHVQFAPAAVPLDRDIVISVLGADAGELTSVVTHRSGDAGYVLISHVVDLTADRLTVKPARGLDVVFVLDRSGSMAGASIEEARRALRLCLRQLREGDHFAIIAFDDRQETFRKELVPFTQKTLQDADTWISELSARGGTELLAPVLRSLALAGRGQSEGRRARVILLTDGQVANEDEISAAVFSQSTSIPIHGFGIGTNVSDALLLRLAEHTRGGVEFIHPGEPIDEKVVATFARAIAPRVQNVSAKWNGIEVERSAPSSLPELIDGEPWTVCGRYAAAGTGSLELRGDVEGERWYLKIPIALPENASAPTLPKLWAAARIRDLEREWISGKHAPRAKAEIIALGIEHAIASRFTSFVVTENRPEEERNDTAPLVRPIPVHAPAGWAMFQPRERTVLLGGVLPSRMPRRAPESRPMAPMMAGPATMRTRLAAAPAESSPAMPLARASARLAEPVDGVRGDMYANAYAFRSTDDVHENRGHSPARDAVFEIFAAQGAAGLWEAPESESESAESAARDPELRQLRATTDALFALLRLGIDASHPQHGPLIRKALTSLAPLAARLAGQLGERALSIAWLIATGPRTRRMIREAIERAAMPALLAQLGDERTLRAHVLSTPA